MGLFAKDRNFMWQIGTNLPNLLATFGPNRAPIIPPIAKIETAVGQTKFSKFFTSLKKLTII